MKKYIEVDIFNGSDVMLGHEFLGNAEDNPNLNNCLLNKEEVSTPDKYIKDFDVKINLLIAFQGLFLIILIIVFGLASQFN